MKHDHNIHVLPVQHHHARDLEAEWLREQDTPADHRGRATAMFAGIAIGICVWGFVIVPIARWIWRGL